MLTLLIGAAGALAMGAFGWFVLQGPWWTALYAILGFFLPVIPMNLWLKRRLEAIFNKVQTMIQASQDGLRRKVNQIQKGYTGSPKAIQKLLEQQQADSIRDALKALNEINALYKWNFLAERQANTLRAQLYYQIKEFEEADRCLAKCFILDPLTQAMKLARLYANGEMKKVTKEFPKAVKRFKYEKAVILYALYSWILVKEERIDEAVALLGKAKDDTENDVLKTNWEHLANGRVKSFSNAALGDQWFALQLETLKPSKVRQQRFPGQRGF